MPKTKLRGIVHATIYPSEDVYVCECKEVAVATQGRTLASALHNLEEAVSLYFDGEDLRALGFPQQPRLRVALDIPLSLNTQSSE